MVVADAPQRHGGIYGELLAAQDRQERTILDFSVNINPYGPSPTVLAAARAAVIDRYPDPEASQLKAALALATGTEPDNVLVGNGAADLLWTMARTLRALALPQACTALIVEPTFSEFRAACLASGMSVVDWRASAESYPRPFTVDLEAVEAAARESGAAVIYICTPNSPTGVYVDHHAISAMAARLSQAVVLVDEAFLPLSPQHAALDLPMPANVYRVRSMTKEHAIPGLRIGYVLATADFVRRCAANRPYWTINAVAQAAAMQALGEADFVAQSRERMLADRGYLVEVLERWQFAVIPGATPFVLARHSRAAALAARLLDRGIMVRDCRSYGLPDYLRLCARPRPDCLRLERELAATLTEDGTCQPTH